MCWHFVLKIASIRHLFVYWYQLIKKASAQCQETLSCWVPMHRPPSLLYVTFWSIAPNGLANGKIHKARISTIHNFSSLFSAVRWMSKLALWARSWAASWKKSRWHPSTFNQTTPSLSRQTLHSHSKDVQQGPYIAARARNTTMTVNNSTPVTRLWTTAKAWTRLCRHGPSRGHRRHQDGIPSLLKRA